MRWCASSSLQMGGDFHDEEAEMLELGDAEAASAEAAERRPTKRCASCWLAGALGTSQLRSGGKGAISFCAFPLKDGFWSLTTPSRDRFGAAKQIRVNWNYKARQNFTVGCNPKRLQGIVGQLAPKRPTVIFRAMVLIDATTEFGQILHNMR